MTDSVAAGRIVWHDLMTRDVQSAVSFYTKAVGWGTEATDIPTVGRLAVISDPQGASICIWTPLQADTARDAPPKLGEFSWHELTTTDVPGALAFYTKLFGWTAGPAHDMGPMGVYQIFERNGVQLGGMFTAPADHPAPPNWLGYVRVDSADRAAERVTQNGGKVLNGPMEVPGGSRIAQCQDPQGGMFAVHSM